MLQLLSARMQQRISLEVKLAVMQYCFSAPNVTWRRGKLTLSRVLPVLPCCRKTPYVALGAAKFFPKKILIFKNIYTFIFIISQE